MKKLNRLLSFALALMLCVSVVPLPVHAADGGPKHDDFYGEHKISTDFDKSQYQTWYTAIMKSSAASYMITAQPHDALILEDETTIVKDNLSANYDKGVIDLPRLQAGYYYKVNGINGNPSNNDNGFSVERTLYPTLSWTSEVTANTKLSLQICDQTSNSAVKTFNLTFTGGNFEGIQTSSFKDISDGLLARILDNSSQKYDGTVNCYPSLLHQCTVVTSDYIVGYKDTIGQNNKSIFDGYRTKVMDNASPGEAVDLNTAHNFAAYSNEATTFNVKTAAWPYIQGSNSGRPEVFAIFTNNDSSMYYNSNTGVVSSLNSFSGTSYKTYRGVYAICYSSKFDLYTVANSVFSGSIDSLGSQNAVNVANGADFNVEEQFGKFNYKPWAEHNKSKGINLDNYPVVKYTSTDGADINVYETALAFNGINGSVGKISFKAPVKHYTITTWYRRPDTSGWNKSDEIEVELAGQAPTLSAPKDVIQYYTFDQWYTDESCTIPANLATIHNNAKEDDTVNLYGKYNYTGGTYNVTFYNDVTGTSDTQTFETRNKPVLPETPIRAGYLFRNWVIVPTTASTSGTVYSPDTFNPTQNQTYLFKTFWDVQGVITGVTTTQNNYYVGDTIDKSKVVVTVQTDNNGTTRTLNTDEFTISPDVMPGTGRQQFVVTYTATGATDTLMLTGDAVTPVSLTARYTGSSLSVGSAINRSNVTCVVNYNNGTTENVTNFTLAPTTIANAGSNTVRVIYGNLSTTITVTGNQANTGGGGSSTVVGGGGGSSSGGTTTRPGTSGGTTSTTNKGTGQNRLQSLSASYTGSQLHVGDVLRANDIQVTATYADGSNTVLSSTAFQFSPSFIRNSGSNTIAVTYGGLSTTFTVNAELQSVDPSSTSSTTGGTSSLTATSLDDQSSSTNGGQTVTGTNTAGDSVTGTLVDGTNPNGTVSSTLGNRLTGAGVPSSNKGTSIAYLSGNNILQTKLYGSAPVEANTVDIMSKINEAGASATSVDVQLHNGAAGNEITKEMLDVVKDKELVLNVHMMSPEDQSELGQWTVMGDSLGEDYTTFDPNITFEVTDKNAEVLTYMAVKDGEYPENTQLVVHPALNTYSSGELVRLYSCDFNKENSHLENSFTWDDVDNSLSLDIANSKRYALSNALAAYEDGSNLTENNSLPSEADDEVDDTDESVTTAADEEFDWDDDTGEEEPFDWGDESVESESEAKSFPWIPVVGVAGAVLAAGGIVICLKVLRRKPQSMVGLEEGEYEDDVIGEDEDDEFEDDEPDGSDESPDDEIDNEEEESN